MNPDLAKGVLDLLCAIGWGVGSEATLKSLGNLIRFSQNCSEFGLLPLPFLSLITTRA